MNQYSHKFGWRRHAVLVVAALLLVLGLLTSAQPCRAAPPAKPDPLQSIDQQPYRVLIDVSLAAHPDFTVSFRSGILADLHNGLERAVGSLWKFSVEEERGLRPAGLDPLSRIRSNQVTAHFKTEELDKLYFLSVEPVGSGYRLAGREWDALTWILGPVHERTALDRRAVGDELVALLRTLFRPVGTLSQIKGGPVVLRARGGALAPHDDAWRPLQSGALFEAYYRYLNKELAVERIQQIPWTYLTVGEIKQGTSDCTLTSGLKVGFSARRRRTEAVALEATRQVSATRLTLVTRPPARRPLGGVEVELGPERTQRAGETPAATEKPAESSEPVQRHVSDRNGQVTLKAPASLDKPLWLFVKSGQNLLARVPFVPGLRPAETLELPDDTLRLDVEGQLAQLQSELVDNVARRAVVAAMTRNRAKARDWDAVDEYLKELSALPQAEAFAGDLSAIRLNSLKAARAQKDKLTELRIQKLCDETAELITNYLSEDKLKELREEVAELRLIAKEEKAAEDQFQADTKAATSPATPAPAAPAAPKPPDKSKAAF